MTCWKKVRSVLLWKNKSCHMPLAWCYEQRQSIFCCLSFFLSCSKCLNLKLLVLRLLTLKNKFFV
ncbi:hypothetical protein OIU84_012319 [Salix udensis]|uniref:Uncharacterized protein n=1 Tax=Salix udensis TaxID=889485 RepID=A0AAD6JH76_9ROSI|nr:hypothetical protein OIU84_012319 [Salix udensis]